MSCNVQHFRVTSEIASSLRHSLDRTESELQCDDENRELSKPECRRRVDHEHRRADSNVPESVGS